MRSFPHFVNGDGYTTQFILYSGTAGQSSARQTFASGGKTVTPWVFAVSVNPSIP